MSIWDTAKNSIKMLDTVVEGLQVIQGFTKIGGDRAEIALKAINTVIDKLLDGFSGKATANAVHLEIQQEAERIHGEDVRIDNKIRDKFKDKP